MNHNIIDVSIHAFTYKRDSDLSLEMIHPLRSPFISVRILWAMQGNSSMLPVAYSLLGLQALFADAGAASVLQMVSSTMAELCYI